MLDPAAWNRQLRLLSTPAACGRAFSEAIAPFGFDTFACGQLDLEHRERAIFYIIEWPERWARFYRESGMMERDPIVGELATRHNPFTWTDLRADRRLSSAGSEAIALAASFGWKEGLVVPMPEGGGRFGLVSMVGAEPVGTEVRDLVALISVCLYNHVRTLVAREGAALPPAGLTPREIDCVRLVAKGQSDQAIARALGIAGSTAHEYVEKAKARLNVKSRPELVAIAVALGIIDV